MHKTEICKFQKKVRNLHSKIKVPLVVFTRIDTIKTETPILLLILTKKAIVSKITKGISILNNIGILGLRNRLAPSGSILPNSFIHFIDIFFIQYLASVSFSSLYSDKIVPSLLISFSSIILSSFFFLQALHKIYGENINIKKILKLLMTELHQFLYGLDLLFLDMFH